MSVSSKSRKRRVKKGRCAFSGSLVARERGKKGGVRGRFGGGSMTEREEGARPKHAYDHFQRVTSTVSLPSSWFEESLEVADLDMARDVVEPTWVGRTETRCRRRGTVGSFVSGKVSSVCAIDEMPLSAQSESCGSKIWEAHGSQKGATQDLHARMILLGLGQILLESSTHDADFMDLIGRDSSHHNETEAKTFAKRVASATRCLAWRQ